MYIKGKCFTQAITPYKGHDTLYICDVKTAGMFVRESSVRSMGEALTGALKYLGMPMYTEGHYPH